MRKFLVLLAVIILSVPVWVCDASPMYPAQTGKPSTQAGKPSAKAEEIPLDEFNDVPTYHDGNVMIPYRIIGDVFAFNPYKTWVADKRELGERLFQNKEVVGIREHELGWCLVDLIFPSLEPDKETIERLMEKIKEEERVIAELSEKARAKEEELSRKMNDFASLGDVTEEEIKKWDDEYARLYVEESNVKGEISMLEHKIIYLEKVELSDEKTEDEKNRILEKIAEKKAEMRELQPKLEDVHGRKVTAFAKMHLTIIALNQELIEEAREKISSLKPSDEAKAEVERLRAEILGYESKIDNSDGELTRFEERLIIEYNSEIALIKTQLSTHLKEMLSLHATLANKKALLLVPLIEKISAEGYGAAQPVIWSEGKMRILTNQFRVRFTPHAFTKELTENKRVMFAAGVEAFNEKMAREFGVQVKADISRSNRDYIITVADAPFEAIRISKIYWESGQVEGVWLEFIELDPEIAVEASVNPPGVDFGGTATLRLEINHLDNIEFKEFVPPKVWIKEDGSAGPTREDLIKIGSPVTTETDNGRIITWEINFKQPGKMVIPPIAVSYVNTETEEESTILSNEVHVKVGSNVSFEEDFANMTDLMPITYSTGLKPLAVAYPHVGWMKVLAICFMVAVCAHVFLALFLFWPRKKSVVEEKPAEIKMLETLERMLGKKDVDLKESLGLAIDIVDEVKGRFPKDKVLNDFWTKYRPELTKPVGPEVHERDIERLVNHLRKILGEGEA